MRDQNRFDLKKTECYYERKGCSNAAGILRKGGL
jgi:hypothetical protein